MINMLQSFLKLCLVTDIHYAFKGSYEEFIRLAVQGGVTSVQFRHKGHASLELAKSLSILLKSLHIPFLINDDIQLALAVNADGVHLGQSDASPEEARAILGPEAVIGWSVGNMAELLKANRSTIIDYVGAGAVFATQSKPDCKSVLTLRGLQTLVKKSKHPVVAIGGINQDNVRSVMACQVTGVAVIAALHGEDPRQAAASIWRNMQC